MQTRLSRVPNEVLQHLLLLLLLHHLPLLQHHLLLYVSGITGQAAAAAAAGCQQGVQQFSGLTLLLLLLLLCYCWLPCAELQQQPATLVTDCATAAHVAVLQMMQRAEAQLELGRQQQQQEG
jgi:hypothetical protein